MSTDNCAAPPPANDELRAQVKTWWQSLPAPEQFEYPEDATADIFIDQMTVFVAQVAARARYEEHERNCSVCQTNKTWGWCSRGAELQKAVTG